MGQSYMTCLKHVMLMHEFPVGFPFEVSALNSLFINIFHDIVARIERRCVIKAKHVLLVCSFVRFCAGKIALALERLRKIELTDQTRRVFIHTHNADKWQYRCIGPQIGFPRELSCPIWLAFGGVDPYNQKQLNVNENIYKHLIEYNSYMQPCLWRGS